MGSNEPSLHRAANNHPSSVIMIVTSHSLVDAAHDIYTLPSTAYEHYWDLDGIVLGHNVVGDCDVISLRGSLTREDFLDDANAIPKWHPQLGYCHSGFLEGMDDVYTQVRKVVNKKVIFTGHSLGGARARILAAMFAANPSPCAGTSLGLCVFGSPKPAFINLRRIIEKSGMQHASFRNRNDIVATVPFILPMWEHTEDWTPCDAAPASDNFEPLRDHSSDLYIAAVKKLPPLIF
jgi:hypothetical protein